MTRRASMIEKSWPRCSKVMEISAVLVTGMEKARNASKTPSPASCSPGWLTTQMIFYQLPDFPCLRQLVDLAQVALPGSLLERQAHDLFSELQPSESSETKTEGEEHEGQCAPGCVGRGGGQASQGGNS
ncbi:uncharacterized protein LOC143683141 [Tamandua tetradactyla]|uniref:uncharacterized protein LOC143683141 n=1 Tax=Tamandua tetradactyla TaxID=48850 RepID=UPI004054838B